MSEWASDFTGSFYNYLSRGCQICYQGASLVLFVTGVCKRNCFYCPLSENRRGRDVIFANEQEVKSMDDIIEEAKSIGALGTGITGGEPLLKLDFVVKCIRTLKAEFGEEHHIHLYTGTKPSLQVLKTLRKAGLDEIRFHPQVSNWSDSRWLEKTLIESKSLGLETGVEIPALQPAPSIIEAVKKAGAFINLNELEFSETNLFELKKRRFKAKRYNCGVVGSEEMAREHFMIDDLKVHYCSSRFKDAVQLRERLKRRAERVSRPFDMLTEDGTLIFGTIVPVCADLAPALEMLEALGVPPDMYIASRCTVEIAGWILEDITEELKEIGCDLALVERYPLKDGPVMERIPL
ncbi:MAG: radical SAM protein [Methanotrichaceae archaeon]